LALIPFFFTPLDFRETNSSTVRSSDSLQDNSFAFNTAKINQELIATWTDVTGRSLNNGDDIEGPHNNVTVSWSQPVDQIELTLEKGGVQTFSPNNSNDYLCKETCIGFPHSRNITMQVIEGDIYDMQLTWDWSEPTWNLDWRFFDADDKLIPGYGCNPLHSNIFDPCSPGSDETITNFTSGFTGELKIEVNVKESIGGQSFTNFSITMSNYEYKSVTPKLHNYNIN